MILNIHKLKSLISFLLIPFFVFTTLNAKNTLSINLSLSKQVNNNAVILVTLKNDTDKALNVLKWNTPLEETLSADLFDIRKDNKKIVYTGRLMKRSQPTSGDYTLFDAGEERTLTISLPNYYKMIEKGNYQVFYKNKISVSEKFKKKGTYKKINTSLTLNFIPDLKKNNQKLTPNFNSCSQSQINVINEAHTEAVRIARIASDAMDNATANTTAERYATWFGSANSSRQSTVKDHFNEIYSALDTQELKFDCTCTEDNVYAYVYPNTHYEVYLCGVFWDIEVAGTDSQSGTIIHELSHFTVLGGTDDHVYGTENAKNLARTSPYQAVDNAENHEYFAENSPHLSMETEGDGSESENSFADATTISNFSINGTISSEGEQDFYKFIATRTAEYLIYAADTLDTIGVLYDSNGNELIISDDYNGLGFGFYYNLIKGETYYLEVSAYSTNIGSYQIIDGGSISRQKTDFNNDTIADVFWKKGSGNKLWYMNADGSHRYKDIGGKNSDYKVMAINDFNYDGISDILWRKGNHNSLWYMNADGTHTYKYIGKKSTTYSIVGVADFDDNGAADILWRAGSNNYIWYMAYDGTHEYKKISSKSSLYTVVATIDMNGDVLADILWKKGSKYSVWYMHSDGTHTYKYIGSKLGYTLVGTDDFNADGIADILWKKDSKYALWYMKKDGTHDYKYIGTKNTAYIVSKVADLNGDGIADILWRKGSRNYIWYMKKDGTHNYKRISSKSSTYIIKD